LHFFNHNATPSRTFNTEIHISTPIFKSPDKTRPKHGLRNFWRNSDTKTNKSNHLKCRNHCYDTTRINNKVSSKIINKNESLFIKNTSDSSNASEKRLKLTLFKRNSVFTKTFHSPNKTHNLLLNKTISSNTSPRKITIHKKIYDSEPRFKRFSESLYGENFKQKLLESTKKLIIKPIQIVNCEELIKKKLDDLKNKQNDKFAEEREYQDYLLKVKKDIPKIDIWKNTIGDKVNTLKSIANIEHRRLFNRYFKEDCK